MDEPRPTRRWYRFSLRTLLALVTLLCVFCMYLGWAMNWQRQRTQVLENMTGNVVTTLSDVPAPWVLRLLGEHGVGGFFFMREGEAELIQVSRLFPESEIHFITLVRGDVLLHATSCLDEGDADQTPYYQNGALIDGYLLFAKDKP